MNEYRVMRQCEIVLNIIDK